MNEENVKKGLKTIVGALTGKTEILTAEQAYFMSTYDNATSDDNRLKDFYRKFDEIIKNRCHSHEAHYVATYRIPRDLIGHLGEIKQTYTDRGFYTQLVQYDPTEPLFVIVVGWYKHFTPCV